MVNIMNADEAKRLAYKTIMTKETKEKEDMLSRIKHAAEMGRYEIDIGYISPEIRAWLRHKGYTVTTYNQYNECGTTISWK